MLAERVCSTSLKSLVALRSCEESDSTTLVEWLSRCFVRLARCRPFSSESFELSETISVLIRPVIALISAVGSSKSDFDFASCVSLPSLSAVA